MRGACYPKRYMLVKSSSRYSRSYNEALRLGGANRPELQSEVE